MKIFDSKSGFLQYLPMNSLFQRFTRFHKSCHQTIKVGFEVEKGDLLAEIHDPYTDEVISELRSPVDGVVFFMHSAPMTYSQTAVFKLII